MNFIATNLKPFFSNLDIILPTKPLCTPSGLIIIKVLSRCSAIINNLPRLLKFIKNLTCQHAGVHRKENKGRVITEDCLVRHCVLYRHLNSWSFMQVVRTINISVKNVYSFINISQNYLSVWLQNHELNVKT